MGTGNDLNWIFGRRSVRIYAPGSVTEDQINQLLRAAMAAPSAMTKDPWRFVVIRSSETLRRLAEASPGGKMLATAAAAIVVCGDMEAVFERHLGYLLQDCSAATENLLLAAHVLGLGACWVGVHPNENATRQVCQELGLPHSILPVAIVSLGLPGEDLPARTRFTQQFVHSERW